MSEPHATRSSSLKTTLKIGGIWLLLACVFSAGAQIPATETTTALKTPERRAAPSQLSQAWRQLTPMQKQALAPLGAQWGALNAQQQSKWLAISKNFTKLPVADQITMHARMADWVALSPQQRHLARLNYNQLQKLPTVDKKAKWEAYQALPAEEKRLFTADSANLVKSTAPTAKPLEAHRRVQVAVPTTRGKTPQPSAVDQKTLLPITPALAVPNPINTLPLQPEMPEDFTPLTETAPS